MKTVTLTMKRAGVIPGQGWYGNLSFGKENYLAMASDKGPKEGKYKGERNTRGGIVIAGLEMYPENQLQKGGKQISFGGKWNNSWGLFDTNPAWKTFMAYYLEVKNENLHELRAEAEDQKIEMEEELLELIVAADTMVVGEKGMFSKEVTQEMKDEKLSDIEAFKIQIGSIDVGLTYYEPEVLVTVE